ncbi:MAG TPA: filamentous hemagglutinin N-terminal domain-containing protein [Leptolyngbyaceae cyanobacterium]
MAWITLGTLSFSGLGWGSSAIAQNAIQADDTLGGEPSVVVPVGPVTDAIIGGAQRGQNLFHSFQSFSIDDGYEAYFVLDPGVDIANIFARVTGGMQSNILGVLGAVQSADGTFANVVPTQAHLFLINPSGIIFGSNAALDLSGSFTATTANSILFDTAGSFSATTPAPPSDLLTINPSAFLFSPASPASITSRSVAPSLIPGYALKGLAVIPGERLTLLGGGLTIDGGNEAGGRAGLSAFGGRIELGSVAGPGTVFLQPNGSLSFPTDVPRGDIALINRAIADVSLDNGGDIGIHARNLLVANDSSILAGIDSFQATAASQAGNITIDATGTIQVIDSFIQNRVLEGLTGNGGNVEIQTNSLLVLGDGQINAVVSRGAKGNAGNVIIRADGIVSFDGGDAYSSILLGSEGKGGNIDIQADILSVSNGGTLYASTEGVGDAGSVILRGNDGVIFDNGTAFSTVEAPANGQGGSIEIQGAFLLVTNGGQLLTATRGIGDAGDILINTRDGVIFEGFNAQDQSLSGAFSSVVAGAQGTGGNIEVTTPRFLLLSNGGRLDASTSGAGNAGNISIQAAGGTLFDNGGAYSTVLADTPFAGGNITVRSQSVSLINGGTLSTSTLGTGNAGNIDVIADTSFYGNNGSVGTLALQASGGNITIQAPQIRLEGDTNIVTSVIGGGGSGGNIVMTANSILAFGDSDILAFSREGRGGNIELRTPAFFGENFRPAPPGIEPILLDENGRVDVNASGAISSGAIALPDVSFIQNSLNDLPEGLVNADQLVAGSCIARTPEGQASFVVTGSDGLPTTPGEPLPSAFPTGVVQAPTAATENSAQAAWQRGDTITEPTAAFQLPDGRLVLARTCD